MLKVSENQKKEVKKCIKSYVRGAIIITSVLTAVNYSLLTTKAEVDKEKFQRDLRYMEYLKSQPQVTPTATPVKTDRSASSVSAASSTMQVINKHLQGNHGAVIEASGTKWNVNPLVLASIIKHETGNCTSQAYLNLKNPGGIMDEYTGALKNFNNVGINEAIDKMAKLLKLYYIDEGKTSIELIQKKYCPVGAKNDPTGLNSHWLKRVTQYYNEMKGDL